MKRYLLLASTVLLVVGCSVDSPVGIDADATREQAGGPLPPGMVPFKASWVTSAFFVGPTTAIISGEGQVTHMGNSSFTGPSEIDPETGDQTGISTMTGADGDQVTIAFEGVSFPLPDGTGVGFNGVYGVTSGTGKFSGATGGGTYEGTFSFVTASGRLFLDGTISQPEDLEENDVE